MAKALKTESPDIRVSDDAQKTGLQRKTEKKQGGSGEVAHSMSVL